jgi:hypothetical protein
MFWLSGKLVGQEHKGYLGLAGFKRSWLGELLKII